MSSDGVCFSIIALVTDRDLIWGCKWARKTGGGDHRDAQPNPELHEIYALDLVFFDLAAELGYLLQIVNKEYPRPTLEQLNQPGETGELVYTKLNEPGYPKVVAVNTGEGLLPW